MAKEKVIHFDGESYILASSQMAEQRIRVLKHGETFGVFDRYGDICPHANGEEGLYHEGMRYLSCSEMRIAGERPLLLSSNVDRNNAVFSINLTNPDISYIDTKLKSTLVHILRKIYLYESSCFERIYINNYTREPLTLPFSFQFAADFLDVFEIRGVEREKRGTTNHFIRQGGLYLTYDGLDGVQRFTEVSSSKPPSEIDGTKLTFIADLLPNHSWQIELRHRCGSKAGHEKISRLDADQALFRLNTVMRHRRQESVSLTSSNEQFNRFIERSFSDLSMLISNTPSGLYPYAGVPWYSTPFGRDGIITALQMIWINPQIAEGVLGYLSQSQALEMNDDQDAEPGKILHETRKGEMAATMEIPFGKYYGTVDATPLYLILAGHYYQYTNNIEFIGNIWENILSALVWLERYGDGDGDGFIEYQRRSRNGLANQGWKDSFDSVFHQDGRFPEGPIALVEVQAYYYEALVQVATLASALGDHQLSQDLSERAAKLKRDFNEVFWSPSLNTFAIALDGDKSQCAVSASNAGHCLTFGIADHELAQKTIATLLDEASFSGWGIRTLAKDQVRYNPMSYHNGSIWPHDNALIALGMARYGNKDGVFRIFEGMFEAAQHFDMYRLPELFCGFSKNYNESPVHYPTSCAPQAWAAATVFMLLQAALGIEIDAKRHAIIFRFPKLPKFLNQLRLEHLDLGGNEWVSLDLIRHGQDTSISILERSDNVEVQIIK